ncbi:MAG: hypothetical protein ACLRZL_00595 [Alistipes communis]
MRYIPLVTALFSTLGAAAQSYDSPATVAIDRDAPAARSWPTPRCPTR